MKLNLNSDKVCHLLMKGEIKLSEIDIDSMEKFLLKYGYSVLKQNLMDKKFNEVRELFAYQSIKTIFINEIKDLIASAENGCIKNLTSNSVAGSVVMNMFRETNDSKLAFMNYLVDICFEYEDEMKCFFELRSGSNNPNFSKNIPIGILFLTAINERSGELLEKKIISIQSVNTSTGDTLAHYMYRCSYETNKEIIDFLDLDTDLKNKNLIGHSPLVYLSGDLKVKNVQTLTYLFIEKLNLSSFKDELLNYLTRCDKVFKKIKKTTVTKQVIIDSIETLFTSDKIKTDELLKTTIEQELLPISGPEIQYCWMNAKLDKKEKLKVLKI